MKNDREEITKRSELREQVRNLSFRARRLVSEQLNGVYRSAFKGRGIEFEEVREYLPGDNVRNIDWKVSARSQSIFVKSFREERELSILLVVDSSASTFSGTGSSLRSDTISQLSAALSYIALANNDKVGLLTFSDKVERYVPPAKGRNRVSILASELLSSLAPSGLTRLSSATDFISKVLKRRSLVFIISDFMIDEIPSSLKLLARKHECTCIAVRDISESTLPELGLLSVRDPETDQLILLDSSNKRLSKSYAMNSNERWERLKKELEKNRCKFVSVNSNGDILQALHSLFSGKSANG